MLNHMPVNHERPPLRLYCFPHAGASSLVYRSWRAPQGTPLEIVGVDQPGRGPRTREPRITDYPELVSSMADHVAADLIKAREERPDLRYATFGHSFGATLSLSVGAAVAQETGQEPVRAVLSAALPPRLQLPDVIGSLNDEELLAKMVADGGTAPGLLSNGTMARLLIGMMREDEEIRRQFHRVASLRVPFPLTLVAARDDAHVKPEHMWGWAEHSHAASRRVEIPGGHFAAIREPEQVLALTAEDTTREEVR
ncbi:thioesterase II family protein [Nocardiopsis valliformis]|uniref:thioesterase II family protein n=1 Tax=Nocardiopsis valliformis TaxID=239974 RepID=UPI00034C5340|nr:alpha/beta fold hydrolase [Nocardiopsis valliformis]